VRADLHIHSSYSDSDYSPQDIFAKAKKEGLGCIAITDHDTLAAFPEAYALGETCGIECISGIEISAEKEGLEIHILGYCVDHTNERFLEALRGVREIRRKRIFSMAEKISSLGMVIDMGEFSKTIEGKVPTRLHLALYMVKMRFVPNLWEAFKRYLSPGNPAYVGRFRFSVEEAIRLINNAGGVAVLAHPHFLPYKKWLGEFIAQGLGGIEVAYPKYTPRTICRYSLVAEEFGIVKCGGSDSHGNFKEFTDIGGVTIPYEWVQGVKDAARRAFHQENI